MHLKRQEVYNIITSSQKSRRPTKVGDNPQEITPLAKTFFGEFMLLIFYFFFIIAVRLDFWCYFTSFV